MKTNISDETKKSSNLPKVGTQKLPFAKGTEPKPEADMPVLPVEIELKVKARLFHWPGFQGSSTMRFKFADTTATITDKGKEYGSIIGCIGAATELAITAKDAGKKGEQHQYIITPADMWNAFCDAVGRTELKFDTE